PVATVAIGKAGAKNAAHLAAQILAITDPDVAARIRKGREDNAADIMKKNDELQAKL
ncbi:MAG: AIR carboxylase family protein, partial [Gammaproteobacteria bacterium]|nr:AIR carboxylase family protein [Gammaproteobacteria bacterium]